jgi:predicted permease
MSLLRRIGNLFSRSKMDREIDAEVQAHIEMRIEDNLAQGMSPEQARRDALIRFGSPTATKERVTSMDATLTLESIWADIRFAFRQLINNPGFAATAIVVLALGIGASVAIFAFVDAALIKPLPYSDPNRLVSVFESNTLGPQFHLSYLDYLDFKRLNHVFNSLDAYEESNLFLTTPAATEHVLGARVSDGLLRTLGVKPVLGRDFYAGEDLPKAPQTVLLSYKTWQSRYGGRKDVLGQTVTLNNTAYTVVGVLPAEFHFAPVSAAEFWFTLHSSMSEDRGGHGLVGVARLKDGVGVKTASAEIANIMAQLAGQYPDADQGRGSTVLPLSEVIVGNLRPILLVLLCGAGLLLLIACVNVAGLLVMRSESRRREIAVRAALGASHARLLRQFMTEGLLLVAGSTALGIGGAMVAMQLMLRLVPAGMLAGMPYLHGMGMNERVSGFAALVALMACVACTLAPALRLYRSGRGLGMQADLAEGSRGSAGTLWRRLGSNLVLVELTAAVVLLACAGLLGKSFYRLLHTDLGFVPDHLAVLRVAPPKLKYATDPSIVALAQRLVERARSLPGVESAGMSSMPPLSDGDGSSNFTVAGRPQMGPPPEVTVRQMDPAFLATVGTRLLRGRMFRDSDDATHPPVMMINQALARRYFPGEDPIGKRIMFVGSTTQKEIVGVLGDIKEGPLDVATKPVLYEPFQQDPWNWFYLVVRTSNAEQSVLPTLKSAVHDVDPNISTFGEETMSERLRNSQAAYLHRASAWLVGGFAAVALLLGVVGLYGVIAYSVSQRTREIGVRMALGAQRRSVYALVMKEAVWITALGIAAGLACSIAAAMLMRKLLFGTQPWDAPTLAAVAALLGVFALLASFIPARRAASVNPVDTLRSE